MTPETPITVGHAGWSPDFKSTQGPLPQLKGLCPSDAMACSPFVVLNLKRLKFIQCADKDATQDTIRALRSNGVQYVALRWHAAAETYVQLEAHE